MNEETTEVEAQQGDGGDSAREAGVPRWRRRRRRREVVLPDAASPEADEPFLPPERDEAAPAETEGAGAPEPPPAAESEPPLAIETVPALMAEPPEYDSRHRRRRWKRLRRRTPLVLALIAAIAAAVLIPTSLGGKDKGGGGPGLAGERDQVTTLMILTLADDLSQRAEALALFGIEPDGTDPVVLFVPTSTLTEIPGEGFEALGKANSLGRAPLQALAVENLLGVEIDHTLSITDRTLGRFVDAARSLIVTVPKQVLAPDPDDPDRMLPLVESGRQRMRGEAAALYFTYLGENETELDGFVRQQVVWEGLFRRFGEEAAPSIRQVTGRFEDLLVSDAEISDMAAILEAFVHAPRRDYQVLPVTPVGTGEEAYRLDESQLPSLLARYFDDARHSGPGVGTRIELRNGNGIPDIGADAASRLIHAGFRIVVTGNAPTFDFRRTRIVVYDDDPESLAVGRYIKDLLGVGVVEIGRSGQTVVDVTVVVGRDYPPERR